jgi:hypothetical protein
MANLPENPTWEAGIYQLETDDPVQGGQDGIDNLQAKQLANRTAYLKQQLEAQATQSTQALANHVSATDPHPQYTTAAELEARIAALVASSPAALDTLNELAAALGNDPNFATTITNVLATKAPLSSPVFTDTPRAPTAPAGTNTTQLATTEFVMEANNLSVKKDEFILGTVAPYCTDANVIATTQWSHVGDTWTGSPFPGTAGSNQGYLFTQVWDASGKYRLQTFYNLNGNLVSAVRRMDNGVWSNWVFNWTYNTPMYACRAWVNFNGTGTPAIRASGNVSSVTKNGTGDYTINFTTAMPDVNYAATSMFSRESTGNETSITARAANLLTSSIRVVNLGYDNVYRDSEMVSVAIFR